MFYNLTYIKMEKLIEILNEYEKSKDFRDYEWRIEKKSKERPCGTLIMGMSGEQFTGAYINDEEMERIIISKKYEFIKWLLENDKINFELDSIIHKHKGIDYNTGKGIAVEKLCNKYESLLMLLAIQDEPINFLISILK